MSRISLTTVSNQGQYVFQAAYNQRQTNRSLERLATGKRLNSAADGPADLAAASYWRNAVQDADTGIARVESRQRALQQQLSTSSQETEVFASLKAMIVSAADDTTTKEQKQIIQIEIDATIQGLGVTRAVSGGSGVGDLAQLRSGGSANVVDGNVEDAVAILDDAAQSSSGAVDAAQYRALKYERHFYEDQRIVAAQALSSVEDTDFAKQATEAGKSQLLTQASLTVMALANKNRVQTMQHLVDTISP